MLTRRCAALPGRTANEVRAAGSGPAAVEWVNSVYRQRVDLASGRFALIEDGLGFSLVPWGPSLERHLGRQVSGIMHPSSNRIEWSLGRARGPTIG